MRLRLACVIAAPVTAFALLFAGGAQAGPPAASPDVSATLVVAEHEVPQSFAAEGVVEAVRQATISAQVQGRVLELPVKAGDTVRAGQVLARIDSRTADQAVIAGRSQVAEAEVNLANARMRYERNRQLLAQKFVSQAAVDQAEAEYKAAQAQVATMKAGAGQAATQQSFTTITAPYAGVVGATHAELGDMATPGKPIVTLFDPRELRVVATLPQATLSQWKRDGRTVVEIPALARSIAPSSVTVIPMADSRAHTVRVRLDLPPNDGLLPGQYARAYFPTGSVRALTVPSSALLKRGELVGVYVAGPKGQPLLRQVRAGETFADGTVEILTGLAAGERIFVNPVAAGMQVAAGSPR
jgi:RND family efflux transporter MFP subunit